MTSEHSVARYPYPSAPVRYPVDLTSCARALVTRRRAHPTGLFTSSGEEALRLALSFAREERQLGLTARVVVPDFICASVPRAVEDAGLLVTFAAVDPATWSYAPGALEDALDAGASVVLAVSYFGLPAAGALDAPERLRSTVERAFVIEDLAQAYGLSELRARVSGARMTVYSFGRGKSLPLGWGGLVEPRGATEQRWLAARAAERKRGNVVASVLNLALAQLQRTALHPSVWRLLPIPDHAPLDTARPRALPPPAWPVDAYLAVAAERHRRVVEQRRANALRTRARLADMAGLTVPAAAAIAAGVALRLPVTFAAVDDARAVRAALAAGRLIKGPNSWEEYGLPSAHARDVAARLLTLPTQPGSEDAVARAVDVIARVLRA